MYFHILSPWLASVLVCMQTPVLSACHQEHLKALPGALKHLKLLFKNPEGLTPGGNYG